jgi:signal transduction histidine kinase
VGWLVVARTSGRPAYDGEDLALASELGRRTALGIENARAFQAAHEAIAAREQVLAVVAHDLRSPLTALRLEVEMLRLEPVRPLAEEDDQALQRVERTVGRMDGLIQDLLDVARLERGALSLDRRPCDGGMLMREAVASLRPLVEGQGLQFDAQGPDTLPAVDLDAGRVLQVVGNLVGNAAKFAPYDGRVGLAWEMVDGELRIEVSDDGPGIPPDQLQHIFGAFWQARHADRRGLGLGLAIVRAITEAHGARIWVESEVGRGTTFVVAFPASRPALT